jgi:hypothetical protein
VVGGLGMGITFLGQGTADGADILARVLARLCGIPLSQSYLFTDALVILLAGLALSWEQALSVLYVAISRSEVGHLKALIREIDPNAFVVIGQASEALGEGLCAPVWHHNALRALLAVSRDHCDRVWLVKSAIVPILRVLDTIRGRGCFLRQVVFKHLEGLGAALEVQDDGELNLVVAFARRRRAKLNREFQFASRRRRAGDDPARRRGGRGC